jgi:hypothetical protein
MEKKSFEIELYITQPQFKKFSNDKAFQASYQQINEKSHSHGNHKVIIKLTKKGYSKLLRNIKNQKGYRFMPDQITGGSLLEKLKNGVKSVGNFAKKYIKKDLINKGIDYAANTLAEKIGNKDLVDKGKNYLKSKVDMHYDDPIDEGSGLTKNCKKGSQEMRDKMSKLRAMRKGKGLINEGEGIIDNVKNFVKHPIVKKLVKGALNIAANDITHPGISKIANSIKTITGLGLNDIMVENGLRNKVDCNSCQPIITGSSKPIHILKKKNITKSGSFKEL